MPSPCTRRTRSSRKRSQVRARLVEQIPHPLDRHHRVGQLRQQRALVAAAGADLEHLAEAAARARGRTGQQQRDHARHHRRFGDRLAVADRQAGVFVRLRGQRRVDEDVARHGRAARRALPRGGCRARAGVAPCARAPAPSRAPRRRVQARTVHPAPRRAADVAVAMCRSRDALLHSTAWPAAAEIAESRRRSVMDPLDRGPPPPGRAMNTAERPRGAHGAVTSRRRQSGNAAWSVRSTCNGVIDTRPVLVAWKSVPSPASRALPAGPIQ